jgi:hypothetical protein
MTAAATALAVVLIVFFTGLGTAKMLAVGPIRRMAAHVGFSTAAYRRIGALEIAGAAGVLIAGLVVAAYLAVLWGGIR